VKAGWQSKAFDDCIERATYTTKIQRKDFLDVGAYPVISQEEAFINGYWDNEDDLFRVESPVVVFGDHTKVLKYVDFDFVLGADGVKLLPPKDFLVPKFFYYQLQSAQLDSLGYARHYKLLKELEIKFPDRAEQHRIVAILDEAFDGIATAKANAEQNLQNARALFESHLQKVFTEQGEGWTKSRLEFITTKIGSGATPRGGEESYKSEGISLIRSLNVHDLGFKYAKLAFLDDAQAEELSNVEIQPRDVLLNITGASVARCCIVPVNVLPARVNQHVSIIRPLANILAPEFLHYLLISKPYKDRLLKTGEEGGSTRQAITKAQIQDFTVEYPVSIDEQMKVVTELDTVRTETQRLESLYRQKLATLDELKKSLLHQAFSGAL
jgi:type I restriction enzyme S subunit